MTKGWTEERRKKQAERIRQTKPWEKSTGPKTQKGKDTVRFNALKHGQRSIASKEIEELLRHNREFVKLMRYIAKNYHFMRRLTNKLNKIDDKTNT